MTVAHATRAWRRYRLVDADGTDLGPLVSAQSRWSPGELMLDPHGRLFRVLGMSAAAAVDDCDGYLVVAGPIAVP
jgi:hypothetical protein